MTVAADKPKKGKQRRTTRQIKEVGKRGGQIAGIAGAVIALSYIRWDVSSQTVRGLRYLVTPGSRGLIWQCPANADGRKDMRSRLTQVFLKMTRWERPRRRMRIRRQEPRCRHKDCRSYGIARDERRICKRKGPPCSGICAGRAGAHLPGFGGFAGRHFEAKIIIIRALSMTAARMSSGEVRVPLKI